MTPTLFLSLSDQAPIELVGGKGHSLCRLQTAGFKVPDGAILTTDAYREFVESNRLGPMLAKTAVPTVVRGQLDFVDASNQILKMFECGTMSAALDENIRSLYANVSGGTYSLAVRSSATAEDLPNASFAGLHRTILNVHGIDALTLAIRDCWASLWNARALTYRYQMGLDHTDLAIALVVQHLKKADVSGILFSANPITGARDELMINASYGLGEAIVGGNVEPDEFVLDRATYAIKEMHTGTKSHLTVIDESNGTRTEEVNDDRSRQQCLTSDEILSLGQVANAVEEHFEGTPQDIEWAFAQGELWILQSRPITNLTPQPLEAIQWDPPEPGAYLQRSQWVEHVPGPVSTLFEDLHMKRSLQEAWGSNLVRRGNHEFMDTQPPACFFLTTTVNGFAYRQVGEPPRTGSPNAQASPHRKYPRVRGLFAKLRMYLTFVPQWRFVSLPRYLREIRSWSGVKPEQASLEQLWTGIRTLSRADAKYWYNDGVWNAFSLSRGTESQLQKFLAEYTDGRYTSGRFLSGLSSPAMEDWSQLESIAQLIRKNQQLMNDVLARSPHHLMQILIDHPAGRSACEALSRYFVRFGHKLFTLDFAEPPEAESRIGTFRSVHSLLYREDCDRTSNSRRITSERRQAIRDISKSLSGKLKLKFWWRLRVARLYYPNREGAMFHLGRAWTVLRPFALELGGRLVKVGTLRSVDDVFYLKADELGKAIRSMVALSRLPEAHREAHYAGGPGLPMLGQLAVERKRLNRRRRKLKPPFLIPGPPPWAPLVSGHDETNKDGIMKGSPVSPGRIKGHACVILSPDDFGKMRYGSILVCPTTTPAWTQLFSHAIGLVTDIGGVLAHGSIVAREYGIPAVLGLLDATERIADGQMITVDGDRGIVECH